MGSGGWAATDALQGAVGASLLRFGMGSGLHLEFATPDGFEVTVEQPLSISWGLRTWTGEPVSGACADALIPHLFSLLHEVGVADSGALRLVLGDATLQIEPHPEYEAWQARSATGLLVVCPPGGGTSDWLSN
ncbi:MAG: hypothetical protein HY876_02485 [Coriobacteriales bacterium]|nr:hypothetical protein [Coriobacteriales bacterium]